ncbi:MAG: hypothetical protein ACKVWV_16520 [Planctomycetota bacterium]
MRASSWSHAHWGASRHNDFAAPLCFTLAPHEGIEMLHAARLILTTCSTFFFAVSCGGGGGGGNVAPPVVDLSTISVYPNPAEARILRAQDTRGTIVDCFGVKDSIGLPAALTSMRVVEANGDATEIYLGPTGAVDAVRAFNGTIFEFDRLAHDTFDVAVTAPDASVVIVFRVTLSAGLTHLAGTSSAGALIQRVQMHEVRWIGNRDMSAQVESSPFGGGSDALVNAAIERRSQVPTTAFGLLRTLTRPPPGANVQIADSTVVVDISNCGVPFEEFAFVTIWDADVNPFSLFVVPCLRDYAVPGRYIATIPNRPTSSHPELEEFCQLTGESLAQVCEVMSPILDVSGAVCDYIEIALGSPLLASLNAIVRQALLVACERVIPALEFICDALGTPIDTGQPNPFEIICSGLATMTDQPYTGEAEVVVRVPGVTPDLTIPLTIPVSPSPQVFPVSVFDSGHISHMTASTYFPLIQQPYDVAVEVACAGPGAFVSGTVSGTDNYSTSFSCLVLGQDKCIVHLPGAVGGTSRRVKAEVHDPQSPNTVSSAEIIVTTQSPPPPLNLAGLWIGSYKYTGDLPAPCPTVHDTGAMRMTLQQTGASVFGTAQMNNLTVIVFDGEDCFASGHANLSGIEVAGVVTAQSFQGDLVITDPFSGISAKIGFNALIAGDLMTGSFDQLNGSFSLAR